MIEKSKQQFGCAQLALKTDNTIPWSGYWCACNPNKECTPAAHSVHKGLWLMRLSYFKAFIHGSSYKYPAWCLKIKFKKMKCLKILLWRRKKPMKTLIFFFFFFFRIGVYTNTSNHKIWFECFVSQWKMLTIHHCLWNKGDMLKLTKQWDCATLLRIW